MKWIKTIFWIGIFSFAIHFSIQNSDGVSLRYAIRQYHWFEISGIPLFLVIFCSIFLGMLMGGIGEIYQRYQLKKSLRENQKIIERLEREIQSCRKSDLDRPSLPREEE